MNKFPFDACKGEAQINLSQILGQFRQTLFIAFPIFCLQIKMHGSDHDKMTAPNKDKIEGEKGDKRGTLIEILRMRNNTPERNKRDDQNDGDGEDGCAQPAAQREPSAFQFSRRHGENLIGPDRLGNFVK